MNHPACSAPDIESRPGGQGATVAFCVFHLIAGVAVAFLAMAGAALFAIPR